MRRHEIGRRDAKMRMIVKYERGIGSKTSTTIRLEKCIPCRAVLGHGES